MSLLGNIITSSYTAILSVRTIKHPLNPLTAYIFAESLLQQNKCIATACCTVFKSCDHVPPFSFTLKWINKSSLPAYTDKVNFTNNVEFYAFRARMGNREGCGNNLYCVYYFTIYVRHNDAFK